MENIKLQDIDMWLEKKQYSKVSQLIPELIDIEIEKQQKIESTVDFFSKLYDKLYYYIIFNKLDIDKPIIKQLESLAMPFQSKTEEEWEELFKEIKKGKK